MEFKLNTASLYVFHCNIPLLPTWFLWQWSPKTQFCTNKRLSKILWYFHLERDTYLWSNLTIQSFQIWKLFPQDSTTLYYLLLQEFMLEYFAKLLVFFNNGFERNQVQFTYRDATKLNRNLHLHLLGYKTGKLKNNFTLPCVSRISCTLRFLSKIEISCRCSKIGEKALHWEPSCTALVHQRRVLGSHILKWFL